MAIKQTSFPHFWHNYDAISGQVRKDIVRFCPRVYVSIFKEFLFLSDLQNGKCVGCLILGPDGEIIQLSMYDKSKDQDQDPSQGDGDTSNKGKLDEPWCETEMKSKC